LFPLLTNRDTRLGIAHLAFGALCGALVMAACGGDDGGSGGGSSMQTGPGNGGGGFQNTGGNSGGFEACATASIEGDRIPVQM
jgi:hypothetical protein